MKTLSLHFPFGTVFLQALIWLALFGGVLEWTARTPAVRALGLTESYGTYHTQLDQQIVNLRARAADEPIDCIFIGNSQVLYGIDPAVVESVYREQTGRTLRCQNFGVLGMTALTIVPMSRILIEDVKPSIILYGAGMFDFTETRLEYTHESIMTSPWVEYQLGGFSIDGWLIEQSAAYRYYLGFNDYSLDKSKVLQAYQADGFLGKLTGQPNITPAEQAERFREVHGRSQISPEFVRALEELLTLDSPEVRIVVFETPVNPVYFELAPRVGRLRFEFEEMLVETAGTGASPVWLTQDRFQVPAGDWYDLVHLNREGAGELSAMLGTLIGDLSQE